MDESICALLGAAHVLLVLGPARCRHAWADSCNAGGQRTVVGFLLRQCLVPPHGESACQAYTGESGLRASLPEVARALGRPTCGASYRPDGNPPQGGPAREGRVALRRWVARREPPRRWSPPLARRGCPGQVAASPLSSGASRLELEASSAPGCTSRLRWRVGCK